MKKYLIILAFMAFCCAGCKKSQDNGAPPSTNSYLPITSGSTWTYFDYENGTSDTLFVKMSGSYSLLNGKKYYEVITSSKNRPPSNSYFYIENHVYALRSYNALVNSTIDLQLYNDTASLGRVWKSSPTDNGRINGIASQVVTTIRNVNGTKVFLGKTYNNVIHTEVDIQYDFGSGYENKFIYDYYFSKGIGILGFNLTSLGDISEIQGILDYNVK